MHHAPLNSDSFYFADKPIKAADKYKFLVPGTIKRELIVGTLLLLTPKAASVERLVEAKEFDGAVSAVEAVRLTLVPERVNGIVSFISDAKKFYANHDTADAERALGTALDHLNRAAAEGLRRIKTDAEKGKRSNEVAGTRKTLADFRKKLQTELTGRASESKRLAAHDLPGYIAAASCRAKSLVIRVHMRILICTIWFLALAAPCGFAMEPIA